MKKLILFITLFLTAFVAQAGFFSKTPQFLKADEAFIFSSEQKNDVLHLNWQIAEGYYLYKQEIHLSGQNITLGETVFPPAEKYQDEFFGETEIFRHHLALPVNISTFNAEPALEVTYQGCTTGFCYPPETKVVKLSAFIDKQNSTGDSAENHSRLNEKTAKKPTALSGVVSGVTEQDQLAESLFHSKYAVFWFFLLGIGLAFTPCVLPMLPLLSAIVIGSQQRPNSLRAFLLSLVYVQGMALTYTLLGLIVAAVGLPFQVALQSPYVLIGLSVVFLLLALSMFGLFNLQLPSAWQTKLTQLSQNQKSGAFGGVFVMGMIAGLVASPCTSAPLSGALLYVAQSGDLFTGGITLYLLALGMGLPLILITVFGNKILPKSGAWMEQVKTAFGFVMLALPVFLLSRILPELWEPRLWALLGTAFFTWLAFQMRDNDLGWALKILFLIAAMVVVKPLQNWLWNEDSAKSAVQNSAVLSQSQFIRISSYTELQQALQANPKAVAMLDLYADWCVACKEFEKYTFSDPKVQEAFNDILLLQVDMTKNSPQNAELMQRFEVLGLPTILFFDKQGNEIQHSRVTGFMAAGRFLSFIQQNVLTN